MKRRNIAQTFAIAAIVVLASGMASTAKAADKGCTNATLTGTFAHTGSGVVTAPPSMAGTLAGAGTDTFDGKGGITGAAILNINGNPLPPMTEMGTYKVNPDCTGTLTVTFSAGGSTTVFFVISDSGNEVQGICTDQGSVVSHVFRRQFPVGDWRQ